MNFFGLIIGVLAMAIIGAGHIVVVKVEYHLGTRTWPLFLVAGVASLTASLFAEDSLTSGTLGILGFSLLWSIHELFKQEERVRKGWFPKKEK
jgi:hypothetical protein